MSEFPVIGLPLFWDWMDEDAPPGFVVLRCDGLRWAQNMNRRASEYAVEARPGRWFSVNEAVERGWIRAKSARVVPSGKPGSEQ